MSVGVVKSAIKSTVET